MIKFKTCPRCDERGYEVLHTHAYCVNCNYSPDLSNKNKTSPDYRPIPSWAAKVGADADESQVSNVIQLKPKPQNDEAEDFEGGAA